MPDVPYGLLLKPNLNKCENNADNEVSGLSVQMWHIILGRAISGIGGAAQEWLPTSSSTILG